MASLQEKIKAAREAGLSSQDIWDHIKDSEIVQRGLGAADETDVRAYLGLEDVAQMEGLGRGPALVGSNVVKGLGQILGLPGTGMRFANSLLPEQLRNDSVANFLPSGQDINSATRSIGLTDREDLVPQNPLERYTAAASMGVGSSLPFAPLAPVAAVISGVTGGLGAEAGNELLPGGPGAFIGGMVGGMTGQGAVRSTEQALAKAAATKALAAIEKELADFKLTRPTVMEEIKTVRRDAEATANADFDTARLGHEMLRDQSVGQARAAIDTEAAAFGAPLTWQEAGEAVQGAANDWMKNVLPTRLAETWKPVDDLIPTDASVSLNSFKSALDDINSSAGAAEPLAALLKPGVPKALQDRLTAILDGQSQLGLPGFDWQSVSKLRTTLGDAMRDPKIMSSVGDQNLKRLYAALSDDMRDTAKGAGALDEFAAANVTSSELFKTAEGTIAKVLDTGKTPEAIANSLASGGKLGATDLNVLRAETPAAADALANAMLRNGSWDNLAPEAKAALVPNAASRATLDGASASINSAAESFNTGVQAAKVARTAAKAAAKLQAENARAAIVAAQAKLLDDQAKAAFLVGEFPPPGSLAGTSLNRIANTMGGGVIGSALDVMNMGPDALMNTKMGAMIGLGLPMVASTAKRVVRDPGLLMGPMIGAATGNALAP